jgi:hypothetical protein
MSTENKSIRWNIAINVEVTRKRKMEFSCNDEKFMNEFNEILQKFFQKYEGKINID